MAELWKRERQIVQVPRGRGGWHSHSQYPTVLKLDRNRWRIFFAARNAGNLSSARYIDVDPGNGMSALGESRPIAVQPGKSADYCRDGIGICAFSRVDDRLLMLATGFQSVADNTYTLKMAAFLSQPDASTFTPLEDARLPGRDAPPSSISGLPCILRIGDRYRMWFTHGTGWSHQHQPYPEPHYEIRQLDSADGIHWDGEPVRAVGPTPGLESGITRACVLPRGEGYEMWYCYRGFYSREHPEQRRYRIGYATSSDAWNWQRRDGDFGFLNPPQAGDWDFEMQCHPVVVRDDDGKRYIFYAGNDYGRFGLGYASLT